MRCPAPPNPSGDPLLEAVRTRLSELDAVIGRFTAAGEVVPQDLQARRAATAKDVSVLTGHLTEPIFGFVFRGKRYESGRLPTRILDQLQAEVMGSPPWNFKATLLLRVPDECGRLASRSERIELGQQLRQQLRAVGYDG